MDRPNSLAGRDRQTMVHPFTNLAEHAQAGPLVIERGEGVYVIDDEGRRYLEGMAGLWCTALGFSEARLVQAAEEQLARLPAYHLFGGKSYAAGDRARRAAAGARAGADVQGAVRQLRLRGQRHRAQAGPLPSRRARQAREAQDHRARARLSRRDPGDRQPHRAGRMRTRASACRCRASLHADCPHYYRFGLPGESEPQFATRLADEPGAADPARRARTRSRAFIAEPVMGAGGVIVPPADLFRQGAGGAARHTTCC